VLAVVFRTRGLAEGAANANNRELLEIAAADPKHFRVLASLPLAALPLILSGTLDRFPTLSVGFERSGSGAQGDKAAAVLDPPASVRLHIDVLVAAGDDRHISPDDDELAASSTGQSALIELDVKVR
jgi:hypothetical protein